MRIKSIEVLGLRNIVSSLLTPGSRGNLISGGNGAGKTSLLEAIYLLGNAKSFRGTNGQSLVNETTKSLKISARVVRPDHSNADFQLVKAGSNKRISINNKPVPNRSTLVRQFPIMFFGHETVSAQISTPQARRVFFDWLLFHVEPDFLAAYSNYGGLLNHFKAGLRNSHKDSELWNVNLAEAGEELHKIRSSIFEELKIIYQQELSFFCELPNVDLVYRNGWATEHALADWLSMRHKDHVRLGYCTVGPHRADFQLRSRRGEVKTWASRGQLKVYYGLYFLTILKYFLRVSDSRPLVLIDDLWAEMDSVLAGKFLKKIMDSECQVFLTSIEDRKELVNQYDMSRFHVEQGLVK
ncbi:MAG: DNA replication and repair protein RecF [Immundisolibacteraceae bacterium]|nr:DNA replication and repair protein RecF [Immundisolibacteraceae bacterium]